MPKFKKISAEEARSKRKDHVRDVGNGVMVRGFKAPSSWNDQDRTAKFVLSSENVDRYGDVVVQAGLDVSRFLQNPIALLFHNSRSWPCGNWSDVAKVLNGRPRRTEATLNFLPEGTDPDADRAAAHVAAGTLRTVSIGFQPDWDEVEMILDDDGDFQGLRYGVSELLEASIVAIPANPDALVRDAAGDNRLARDLVEDVLDNWARTPEGILLPRADYEKAYKVVVEKIAADAIVPVIETKDAADEDCDDPDDEPTEIAEVKANDESWACKASRDLPIDDSDSWDGAAAKTAMLDAAGIGGDSPDHAAAARGFLAVDTANSDLRGSYKLPFATMVNGELKAVKGGIDAAASRVPNTSIPDGVKEEAKAVIESYESKMSSDKAFKDFLDAAQPGDALEVYYKLLPTMQAEPIGVTLKAPDTDKIRMFELKSKVTADQIKLVEACKSRLAGATEEAAGAGKVLLSADEIATLTANGRPTDKASAGEEHESMLEFTVLRDGKYHAGIKHKHSGNLIPGEMPTDADVAATKAAIDAALAKMPGVELATDKDVVEPIVVELDMGPATEKLNAFEKIVDGVITKLKSVFGGDVPAIEVRNEPVLPVPVPSDEEMSAALARAEAASKRLAAMGIVEA